MIKHRRRPFLILAVLAAAILASVQASTHGLDDYRYALSVGIDNQSGSTFDDTPVAVQMQPDNLVSNGFLEADAQDWRPATEGGTALEGMAQGMGSTAMTWWVDIPSGGDGSTSVADFHMGNTSATRDQRFRFSGGDDVTATDHPNLDASNNLSVSIEAELRTIPAGETMLAQKSGSYELGVRKSNE